MVRENCGVAAGAWRRAEGLGCSGKFGAGSGWSRPWQPAKVNPVTWCFPRWSERALARCCRRKFHTVNRLFLLALLSLIDAMLEMPMSEVLAKLPLDGETKAVLLGQPSTLRPV